MNHYYQAWTEAAACRSVGGDFWFPEVGEPTWMAARLICQACPVLSICRDWVMRTELGVGPKARFGVTGGMTPSQRIAYEPQWLAEQAAGAA
jgi:hypothetical protein